ncbi:ATP synthase mitochondrial F1 complex assembly factor 2 [Microdochium nivale]|nr:ATP synthase mitochondrial F1 complex assembly factor 2 [Microdochium nivale]
MTQPLRLARRLAMPTRCAISSTTVSSALGRTASKAATIHTTPPSPATVSSIHGTGPPPGPPEPAVDSPEARLAERRTRQAALLQQAQDIRAAAASSSSPQVSTPPLRSAKSRAAELSRKRFWKDVHVVEVDGAYEVHLDARPLRRPDTKEIVRLPLSKPLLATALAVEWDMMTSTQHATREHLIPLMSLVCRALDVADEDAGRTTAAATAIGVRAGIARMAIRYFDTDTLLCWAPPPKADDSPGPDGLSLRDTQRRAADDVIGYLNSRVWPGIEIEPTLDEETIIPRRQKPATRQIIEGWIMGLDSWELAGLERAVLAGKSLLGAARLVAEWSEGGVGVGVGGADRQRYGIEDAVKNATIEVRWQTGRWGEVDDTHDVEKEDLARQFGSVVLLIGGTGSQ